MSKLFTRIASLSLFILLSNYSVVNAQDSPDSFNVIQKDSILKDELQKSKKQLYQLLLQQQQGIEINLQTDNLSYNLGTPMSVYLSTTGLMFMCPQNRTAEILFADITDYKFKVYSINNNIQSGISITEYKLKIGSTIISVRSERQYILKTLANLFINIQKLSNELNFKMNAFRQVAALHNALANKPYISDEQRKYIVQAEAYTKLYNYQKAIELNKKIIAIHPTAYPNAYLNIAILFAETNRLYSAIYNMKKFLLLNPTTEDEQFGKSKISEWEIILNN